MARIKGLDIARDFYFAWGKPFLEQHFPDVAARAAAGRMQGSDVLGADDEISRDHCWGPQFWLYFSEADFADYGQRISETMNAVAPNPWNGHKLAGGGDKAVMVVSIPRWFVETVRTAALPPQPADWQHANESALYFVRHGAVFFDGSGELTAWRQALAQYPRHRQRARLAEECFRVWHHGQYNFVQRMSRRRDPLPIAMALGEFVAGVMRMVLLLEGDYAPYWKWLALEFRKRPAAGEYAPLLDELMSGAAMERQVQIVNQVSDRIYQSLRSGGWVTGSSDNKWLLSLLNAYNEMRGEEARQSG